MKSLDRQIKTIISKQRWLIKKNNEKKKKKTHAHAKEGIASHI